jgi:predicted DNA-binding antitoxin AbrB/MazE fold protein
MTFVIQAVYENGVLKPLEKLALGEHQQVQITVEPEAAVDDQRGQDRHLADVKESFAQPSDSQSVVVPITTLQPEPFDLFRDVPVVVQPTDDGYLATFFDANIGMTGDTKEESVANLRMLLVDVFEELEKEEAQLGPHPARQLAVLRSFMKRRP